jgi:surfeit locus 1 family protein
MLQRLRDAGLIWPTLFALPALAVLIGLGAWQLQRKVWKDGLVAAIGERSSAAPVALGPRISALGERAEYTRVRVSGRFLHAQERHLFMGAGWHVLTPLVTDDGAIVLVNRGIVPAELRLADRRAPGQVEGRVEIVGLVRSQERPGTFTPPNDGPRNNWFWRDVEAMLQCWNAPSISDDCVALQRATPRYPFVIDAGAEPANPGGWPKGGVTNLAIANRHLEYAITWFGLAATLIGVFVAFVAGRLRNA